MRYYPICIDTLNKKILVVGGGNSSYLKLKDLAKTDAHIDVVSEKFLKEVDELNNINRNIILIRENIENFEISDDYHMVFICTDNHELNMEICKYFKDKKSLVMVADSREKSDFITSAILHKDNITVSVNTQGKSPTAAKLILNETGKILNEEFTEKISLLCEIREQLKMKNNEGLNIGNIKSTMDSLICKNNSDLKIFLNDIEDSVRQEK